MPRRATRDDGNAVDGGTVVGRDVQAVEPRDAFVEHEPAPQRPPHRVRLLEDFLLHEMRIGAQRDGFEVPGDIVDRAQLDVRFAIEDVISLRREHGDIAVIEVDDGSGVFDDRRSIGRDKEFIVADPE